MGDSIHSDSNVVMENTYDLDFTMTTISDVSLSTIDSEDFDSKNAAGISENGKDKEVLENISDEIVEEKNENLGKGQNEEKETNGNLEKERNDEVQKNEDYEIRRKQEEEKYTNLEKEASEEENIENGQNKEEEKENIAKGEKSEEKRNENFEKAANRAESIENGLNEEESNENLEKGENEEAEYDNLQNRQNEEERNENLENGQNEEVSNENLEKGANKDDNESASRKEDEEEIANSNEYHLLNEEIENAQCKENEKMIRIKKCRVKLPMKGERFRVKFVDNFNVPHKLHLKNTDKVAKLKLNTLLAKKLHEPLTKMPMSRLKEKGYVLIKFRRPAMLIRAQVKWIQSEDKIGVQDIDSVALYQMNIHDIYVLDDELIANIYPRVFICNLSEFDGKDIFWNPMIRDLYISTLRYGQISIEIRTFHHTVLTYDVHLKLYLDEKKFVNLNEWLGNSFIPYLVYLKNLPPQQASLQTQKVANLPTEIFFPYVKLLKE